MGKEIRLGSNENMININLGSTEVQEVYLGDILVWQNNLGPMAASISLPAAVLGMTYNANVDGEIDGADGIYFGTYNGSFTETSVTWNTISDLDNEDEDVDRIIGYRIVRPDGTYFAGDPDGVEVRTDGAPVADFGIEIPGVTTVYDADLGEFTTGPFTVASATVPVSFRDTDTTDTEVNGNIAFQDSGIWMFLLVDSRGGESPLLQLDITGEYQLPSGTIAGGGNGLPEGSTNTFTYNPTGGEEASIQWVSSPNSVGGPWTTIAGQTGNTLARTTSPFNAPVFYSVRLTQKSWLGNVGAVATDAQVPTGRAANHDTFAPQNQTISTGTETFTDMVTTPCTGAIGPSSCDCQTINCPGTAGTVTFNRLNRMRTDIQGLRCTNQNGGAIVADSNCVAYTPGDAPVVINLPNQIGNTSPCNGPSTPNVDYVNCALQAPSFGALITEGAMTVANFGPDSPNNVSSVFISYTYPATTCPACFQTANAQANVTCGGCSGCFSWQMVQPANGTNSNTVSSGGSVQAPNPIFGTFACDNKFNGGACAEAIGAPCSFSFV